MTDNQLSIEQINNLDASAFHSLYKDYYKALVGYAFQMVGEMEVAKDIVQDLFSTLWERKNPFQSMASLRVYLYNSVRNASLDYLRHKDIESGYLLKVLTDYQEHRLDGDGEDDFFSEEIYRQLFQTIDTMPERCREIFTLAMQGKKNMEIATTLQISMETVKTQKKRGMLLLRKKLDNRSMLLLMTVLMP